MRELLLAACVAAAPLAWCDTAGAQILAEVPISLSGWRAGEPASGIQILVGYEEGFPEEAVLFDQVVWTPADVGRVVSIGSVLDDPDFALASARLADGLASFVSVRASIEPGGGGPGMASYEPTLFEDALHGEADFAGFTVDAIAVRLDALTLNDPSDGSVDLHFTLLVVGAEGGGDSPELAQCTDDLEEARFELFTCVAGNSELGAALASAQAALAAALADVDADGVRDPGDACLGTEPATAVDGVGCSLAQFCTAIDASGGSGRSTCNRSDWRNDEPLADSPNDCKASGGRCEPR